MCSAPTPPSPPEVNPYAGLRSDPRFDEAANALGISDVNSDEDVRQINEYLLQQDIAYAQRDPNFETARQQLLDEGRLTAADAQDARYLSEIQGRMYDITQDEAYAEQQATTEKAAQDFQEMMREEAARNNFQAQQGAVAPVLAPVVQPKPIPVAPPTPRMEIQKTPPPPMLTQSENNMAIVRQPNTARTRQRQRSRGTASLSS